jgi:hypothetical protein
VFKLVGWNSKLCFEKSCKHNESTTPTNAGTSVCVWRQQPDSRTQRTFQKPEIESEPDHCFKFTTGTNRGIAKQTTVDGAADENGHQRKKGKEA